MITMFKKLLMLMLASSVVLWSANFSLAENHETKPEAPPEKAEGLKLELKVDKRVYKLAEPVKLTLTVSNKSQVTFKDSLRSSQVYDFVVRQENKEVWRWSADKAFLQVITEFTLASGASKSFEEIWKQVDNSGKNVPAGRYHITGMLATRPERSSNVISIEIRETLSKEEEERIKKEEKEEEEKKIDERFGVKRPGDFKERAIEALKILERRFSDAADRAVEAGFEVSPNAIKEIDALIIGIKNAVRDEDFKKAQDLTKNIYDISLALVKKTLGFIPPQVQSKADSLLSETTAAFNAKDPRKIGDIAKDLSDALIKVKEFFKPKSEAEEAVKEASKALSDLVKDADKAGVKLAPEKMADLNEKLKKAEAALRDRMFEDAEKLAEAIIDEVEKLREELKLLREAKIAKEKAAEAAREAKKAKEESDKEFETLALAESVEEAKRAAEAIKRAAEQAQEAAKRALERAKEARKRALERKDKEELQAADAADVETSEALKAAIAALENALKAAELASERAKRQLEEVKAKLAERREIRESLDTTNALLRVARENAQRAAEHAAALAKHLAEVAKRLEDKAKEEQTAEAKAAAEKAKAEAKKAEAEAKRAEQEARKKALEAAKEVSKNAKEAAELAAKAAKEKSQKAEKEPPKVVQKLAREASAQLEEAIKRFEEAKAELKLAIEQLQEAKKAAQEARKRANESQDLADIAAAEEAEKLAKEAEAAKDAAEAAKDAAEAAKNQTEQAAADTGSKATDTNGDGKKDIFDIVKVAIKFGIKAKVEVEELEAEDINGDGEVNIFDIVLAALGFAGEKVIIPPTEIELKVEGIIIVKVTQAAPALDPMQYTPALKVAYEALKAQPNPTPEIQKTIALLEQLIWGKTTSTSRIVVKNQLLQNYPNPFNPETWIPFELSQSTKVNISIYNALGQLVRVMDLGQLPSGSYVDKNQAAYWDGRNSSGDRVSSGVYFYSIKAGSYVATKKMIVLK